MGDTANQQAQALLDAAVENLKKTTVGYAGHTPAWESNPKTYWSQGLSKIAQARALIDPAPAVVAPVWDGRASAYTSVVSQGDSVPAGLACIYEGNDIALVDDATWGKAWDVTLTAASKNPWWTSQPANLQSAELTQPDRFKRIPKVGDVEWWAQSVVLPDWADPGNGWHIFSQLGYPTLSSPPGSFIVLGSKHWANTMGVPALGFEHHGGIIANVGDQCAYSVITPYRPVSEILNRRVDLIAGVRWDPTPNGWWVFATRVDGGQWVTHENVSGVPTAQALSSEWALLASEWPGPLRPIMDKQGGYMDSGSLPAGWTRRYRLRGLTRHATRADAEGSL